MTAVSVVLSSYCLVFGAPDGLGNVLPVVFALYALGRYGANRDFWPGLALTAATILVHQWRDPQPGLPAGPTILFWAVVLGSGGLGWILRARSEEVEKLNRRAGVLEEEHERRAREAVAAERGRIARELHDLVGHGLSLIVLQAVRAQGSLHRPDVIEAQQQLERLETVARNTMAEMRRLLTVVGEDDAPLKPQPSVADVGPLVEQMRSEGIPVELRIGEGVADVPSGVGLVAYRLVQEGLTNVMKHGGRTRQASVTIARDGTDIVVEVLDFGDRPQGESREGRGLAGMQERVALYGGRLEAGPRADGGFRVHASLPIGMPE